MAELSPKQSLFVKEYLIDLNATRAAIAAKYSKHTAKSQGSRLLTNVDIREAIDKVLKPHVKKLDITIDDVLSDIMETRQTCASHMENIVGELDSAAVNGRIKSNDQLGRYLAMFTEKVEHSGEIKQQVQIVDDIK